MMRKIFFFLLIFLYPFIFPQKIRAIIDPRDYPNNKVGIHILEEKDIEKANQIINSNGGEYGYVTLVIREDERDIKRWQKIFDIFRSKKIVPLVRIAGKQTNKGWSKLEISEIDNWINFLNSLNWITKNRYVIVGNEPNHADEWGGSINAIEYADFVIEFSKKLKEINSDFFIISGGLDNSAPNNIKKGYLNTETYLITIKNWKREYFDNIDGWSSHSYPNPNFSGPITASGKTTVRSYLWDINFLKQIGVNKNYPIFITETGWKHTNKNINYGNLYQKLYLEIYSDPNIIAVTPFLLSYTIPPFDQFSWTDTDNNFYPFVEKIINMPKTRGEPEIIDGGRLQYCITPIFAGLDQSIKGYCVIQNIGQKIWSSENISLKVNNSETNISLTKEQVKPGEEVVIEFEYTEPVTVEHFNGQITILNYDFILGNHQFGTRILKTDLKPIEKLFQLKTNIFGFIVKKFQ